VARFARGVPQPHAPPADPGEPGQPQDQHGHGLDQVRGQLPQVGGHRGDAEGDLARLVPRPERAAVDHVVEGGHARTEERDRPERVNFRRGQGQQVTLGDGEDRGLIGMIIGLHQSRRGGQDRQAQHGERPQGGQEGQCAEAWPRAPESGGPGHGRSARRNVVHA
jgi:hypothetical protein